MKNSIQIHDRTFRVMIPAEQLEKAVSEVAAHLNADYGEGADRRDRPGCGGPPPLLVGVLNGSFVFLADLVRRLDFPCEVSFVKVASYCGDRSSGEVRSLIGLEESIEGREVIVVEEIVETGGSIEHLVGELRRGNPASIRICTLFFKPAAYTRTIPIDYAALRIGNAFIVGYGMDYNGLGRNLRDIYVTGDE